MSFNDDKLIKYVIIIQKNGNTRYFYYIIVLLYKFYTVPTCPSNIFKTIYKPTNIISEYFHFTQTINEKKFLLLNKYIYRNIIFRDKQKHRINNNFNKHSN